MSTVNTRPHPHGISTGEQSIHESLTHTSMMFLIGGFSAAIGVLLLATAAALGVGDEIGSLIGGYIVVGAAIAVSGAVVIGVARSRLSRQSLNPTHTIDEIRRDVPWLSHEAMRRRA